MLADIYIFSENPYIDVSRGMTIWFSLYNMVLIQDILSMFSFLPGVAAKGEWFVASSGEDNPTCGQSRPSPCRTIHYAMERAPSGDRIHIDGSRPEFVYEFCSINATGASLFDLSKSMEIVGVDGRPKLGCRLRSSGTLPAFSRLPAGSEILLRDVELEDGIISISNSTLEVYNATLWNVSITSMLPCNSFRLLMSHTEWYGKTLCHDNDCNASPVSNICCNITDITLIKSKVFQHQIRVSSYKEARADISDMLFDNRPDEADFMGGLYFTFSASQADIFIRDTIFSRQLNPTRLKGLINLFEAALWLKAEVPTSTFLGTFHSSNATAELVNVTFTDNERGATLIGPFRQLDILRCTFARNIAMHHGAAVLVITEEVQEESPDGANIPVRMDECLFVNNSGGNYKRVYNLEDPVDSFRISGNEVNVNTTCCNGVLTFMGKGGAIRIQRGALEITNSMFINNTARLLGGSIFVDIEGRIDIRNCQFENTPVHEHALQGDILYSDGRKVIMENVKLIAKSAIKSLSILRHSGDHWSINIRRIWVQCPVGYNLRATNSSAYGVHAFGLQQSHELDQLTYYCESCPRHKYSLDYGYMNYSLVYDTWAFFALKINGEVPQKRYTGSYEHHEVQCIECPYGGQCHQGIQSVANFWGYVHHNHALRFQHCPTGYCCLTRKCLSHNSCAALRQGRLCGRCAEGYSEALFSPTCIPNDQCGPLWLWPFAISVGLAYAAFLLFQTDLKQFLFSNPVDCCASFKPAEICCRRLYASNKIRLKNNNQDVAESRFIDNREDNEHKETPNGVLQKDNDEHEEATAAAEGSNNGFLIILFYYFQDALLLHVDTVYVRHESKSRKLVKSVLSGLFKFQLDLFHLIEEVCAVPDTTAAPKLLAKAFIVPYVILIFFVMYIANKWTRLMRGKSFTPRPDRNAPLSGADRKTFSTRLSSGFILALLFTFQKMGTTVFMLLNCVPVEEERVLFIDGHVTCYQYWQYGVMAYAVSCVSPFFLVLMFGPGLIRKGQLTLSQFFLACICPLPALLWWGLDYLRLRTRVLSSRKNLTAEAQLVLEILQGPFKETGPVCWAGVLIGRRLVLILLYTFVNDALIRLLCMLLTCFIILLHHVHVNPYKDSKGNMAGTASAAALVTLGTINLVRAGFEAAEYTPTGPNGTLMKAFVEIENILMLWSPLAVMSIVLLILVGRVGMLAANMFGDHRPNPAAVADQPEEDAQL